MWYKFNYRGLCRNWVKCNKDFMFIFLQEQERRKIDEYEKYLKEKLQVDEIVKKIYEEDQR